MSSGLLRFVEVGLVTSQSGPYDLKANLRGDGFVSAPIAYRQLTISARKPMTYDLKRRVTLTVAAVAFSMLPISAYADVLTVKAADPAEQGDGTMSAAARAAMVRGALPRNAAEVAAKAAGHQRLQRRSGAKRRRNPGGGRKRLGSARDHLRRAELPENSMPPRRRPTPPAPSGRHATSSSSIPATASTIALTVR